MSSLRASFIILLSLMCGAHLSAKNDLSRILAIHQVWIQEGLSWEKDPGDKQQSWAGGSVLHFAKNGDFVRFEGVLIRHGPKLALSEGESEIVYSGTWKMRDGRIQVDYRLVGMYKVLPKSGEKLPSIPGPLKHAEIRPDPQSPMHIEFDGTKFETTSALSSSGLRSRLQVYAPTDAGKRSSPN